MSDQIEIVIINNWASFQHYNKRRPPWIRLYRTLLDKREYRQLTDAAARLLFDLWMLAGEWTTGAIRMPIDDIAWRLRLSPEKTTAVQGLMLELEKADFIKRASVPLADCKQDATPEAEAEAEAETGQITPKNVNKLSIWECSQIIDAKKATLKALVSSMEFKKTPAMVTERKQLNTDIAGLTKRLAGAGCK